MAADGEGRDWREDYPAREELRSVLAELERLRELEKADVRRAALALAYWLEGEVRAHAAEGEGPGRAWVSAAELPTRAVRLLRDRWLDPQARALLERALGLLRVALVREGRRVLERSALGEEDVTPAFRALFDLSDGAWEIVLPRAVPGAVTANPYAVRRARAAPEPRKPRSLEWLWRLMVVLSALPLVWLSPLVLEECQRAWRKRPGPAMSCEERLADTRERLQALLERERSGAGHPRLERGAARALEELAAGRFKAAHAAFEASASGESSDVLTGAGLFLLSTSCGGE